MQRPPRVLIPLVVVVGLSLLGDVWAPSRSLAATPERHPSATAHPAVTAPSEVTLTPGAKGGPGVQVAMPPAGLSLEYEVMAQDLATGPCAPPALVAELLRLGSPPLALAGDSQDLTAPAGALSGTPLSWEAATFYPLSAGFWSQLHCLLSATRDPLTAGLNARAGEPLWAAQMVAGAQSAASGGLALSLGNEPDLYRLPNYASLSKPQVAEEAAAVNVYLRVASALREEVGGGTPLVGPELAKPTDWRRELPRVIEQLHLGTVGVHLYPLTACASPRAVTVGGLLSAYAADAPRRLAWVVADAGAARVPAIISEANSASCGGAAGVSDSPAAAVWAVRFVLSALKTGFREVRFHFSGGPYDPFVLRGGEVLRRPLESALAALNRWLPVGASLKTAGGVRGLVATRVVEPAGGTLLILDNERAQARAVVLRDAHGVRIEVLSARRAGLLKTELSSPRPRKRIVVAPNSVVVLSSR